MDKSRIKDREEILKAAGLWHAFSNDRSEAERYASPVCQQKRRLSLRAKYSYSNLRPLSAAAALGAAIRGSKRATGAFCFPNGTS